MNPNSCGKKSCSGAVYVYGATGYTPQSMAGDALANPHFRVHAYTKMQKRLPLKLLHLRTDARKRGCRLKPRARPNGRSSKGTTQRLSEPHARKHAESATHSFAAATARSRSNQYPTMLVSLPCTAPKEVAALPPTKQRSTRAAYFRKHSSTIKVSAHPPSTGVGSLQGIVAAALLSANPQPVRPTGASGLVSSNGEVACYKLRNCRGNPCDPRCHNGMQLRSGVV